MDAWDQHLAAAGPQPNAEMIAEAKALRAEANAKLTAVNDVIASEAARIAAGRAGSGH